MSNAKTQPLTPPQPVDDVWAFTDDPAVARPAVVRILAAQYRQRRIVLGAFVVALVFAVLAYTTGIMPLALAADDPQMDRAADVLLKSACMRLVLDAMERDDAFALAVGRMLADL